MMRPPAQITLAEWDRLHERSRAAGRREPAFGGPLGRHVQDGDVGLLRLRFDNSPAALDLWNFLLTEEQRLFAARAAGRAIVGTMKDLGTVPVMAYSLPGVTAFYPDGAWWIPCIMEREAGLLAIADSLGIGESFCPVRAMLGAFESGAHFPEPDLLTCSVGAVCDDFSAIAQRLEKLGRNILWWQVPHRRPPDRGEAGVPLPGGLEAPLEQVALVRGELARVRAALQELSGRELSDGDLRAGIRAANGIRAVLRELRETVFRAEIAPLPALELLVAEMMALHFCSDRDAALEVLAGLLDEVRRRVAAGAGFGAPDAARVFWVNPVADLAVMNLLEECGGRICGTEFLFTHALDAIPRDLPPMEALARTALSDPMVGPAADRARRICADARRFGAEAVLISRIPGASHCALEGTIIADVVARELGLPTVEIEVPSVSNAVSPALVTRLTALVETVRMRRS